MEYVVTVYRYIQLFWSRNINHNVIKQDKIYSRQASAVCIHQYGIVYGICTYIIFVFGLVCSQVGYSLSSCFLNPFTQEHKGLKKWDVKGCPNKVHTKSQTLKFWICIPHTIPYWRIQTAQAFPLHIFSCFITLWSRFSLQNDWIYLWSLATYSIY